MPVVQCMEYFCRRGALEGDRAKERMETGDAAPAKQSADAAGYRISRRHPLEFRRQRAQPCARRWRGPRFAGADWRRHRHRKINDAVAGRIAIEIKTEER